MPETPKHRSNENTKTVRVKNHTFPKLQRIAEARRWKLNETIDALCDDYLDRYDIPKRKRRAVR